MTRFIARHKLLFTIVLSALTLLLYFINPWPPVNKHQGTTQGHPMSLVYAFAASKMEGNAIERLMNGLNSDASGSARGQVGVNDVVLFITGIGPKRAKASASAVLVSPTRAPSGHSTVDRPGWVLVVGTCGSLKRSIAEDEVIVYRGCFTTENDSLRAICPGPLVEQITSVLRVKGINPRSAVGISSTRIATTKEEKLKLAKTGADVVDMESHEIVAVANQAHLPVAVIRVVSDSLDRQIPDLNLALLDNGEIDSLELLKVAIGSPVLSARIFAASRRALKKLSAVLEIVLAEEACPILSSEAISR